MGTLNRHRTCVPSLRSGREKRFRGLLCTGSYLIWMVCMIDASGCIYSNNVYINVYNKVYNNVYNNVYRTTRPG